MYQGCATKTLCAQTTLCKLYNVANAHPRICMALHTLGMYLNDNVVCFEEQKKIVISIASA